MNSPPVGPGLKKAGPFPLVRTRHWQGWALSDYRVRELFESADIMSEGANRPDGAVQVYYGTTSIRLAWESAGGPIPDAARRELATILPQDPHARVRALRIACREALVRAGNPLEKIRAELRFEVTSDAIRIHVDVEAKHLQHARRTA